jgi:hypothetical protein
MSQIAEIKTAHEVATERSNITNYGDNLLSVIERAARDQNVDIEKFERLMAMRERLEAEAARKAFNTAIAAAKGEIPVIAKNRKVDFTSQKGRTNYEYEDLAGIAEVIDPIVNKYGLSYRYKSKQEGQRLTVTCIVTHVDGHCEETTLQAGEDHTGNKNSIQAISSAATYLQRYTLKMALGLAVGKDDDGKKADAKPDEYEGVPLAEQGQRAATYGVEYLRGWWCKQSPEDRDKFTNSGELAAWKAMAEKAGA